MATRNTSLDCLRAFAIITVVNCHVASSFAPDGRMGWLQVGGHGVDLFFALSGWLIGKHLMQEIQRTGSVDLKRFWLRRWLRTLPAYYAVLLFTFAWQFVSHRTLPDWRYLVFMQNYETPMPYFGVSWSLCVEEHFYLLVAPLSWLIVKRRWALVLVPVVFLVPVLCRNFGWFQADHETHVVFDLCASGVTLAAISVFAPRFWQKLCRWAPLFVTLSMLGIGAAIVRRLQPTWGIEEFGRSWWLLIAASFILLANSNVFFEQRTGWWPIRFIAERAYSLYLLHIEAIVIVKRFPEMPFWLTLAFVWAISLLLAEGLYRWVELPGMKIREWFRSSQTHPSTNIEANSKSPTVTVGVAHHPAAPA